MNAHRHVRSHGFILLMALLILTIVATAIATLAASTSSEARAVSRSVERAQVDQMLLAGAVVARDRLEAGAVKADESFDVTLPRGLADAGAALSARATRVTPADVEISIAARLRRTHASQIVRFSRQPEGGKWSVASVELEP